MILHMEESFKSVAHYNELEAATKGIDGECGNKRQKTDQLSLRHSEHSTIFLRRQLQQAFAQRNCALQEKERILFEMNVERKAREDTTKSLHDLHNMVMAAVTNLKAFIEK